MATFAFVPSTVPSEVSCNPISATGLVALLGTAALAGTFVLDRWQSTRPADDELCLVATVNQKLIDVLGSGANFKVSPCERKGCLQIELDIGSFSGMPRAERECRLANLLEDVVEDKLTEIEIIWCQSSADKLSRCNTEVHLPAQNCIASDADTEIDSDSAEGEGEDEDTASISSACCSSCDDASNDLACPSCMELHDCSCPDADTEIDSQRSGGLEMSVDPEVSSCEFQHTAAVRCESTQLDVTEPTKTIVEAAGVPDGTAIPSGIVAARRQQILARRAQIRPADTWLIRQGIVPELRRQWTKDDMND